MAIQITERSTFTKGGAVDEPLRNRECKQFELYSSANFPDLDFNKK